MNHLSFILSYKNELLKESIKPVIDNKELKVITAIFDVESRIKILTSWMWY